ncbi:MAG: AsmA-like C-terminal domain-containing protein [Litorimonas sp.]
MEGEQAAPHPSVGRFETVRSRIAVGARYIGYRIFRLGGEAVSVLIALGILALYFASTLANRQSADLTAFKPNFERWFSQSFDGATARTGALTLDWNPVQETITFTADDIVVFSAEGERIQALDRLKATTTRADFVARRAVLRDVEIVGGEVTWLRKADGSVLAGLGTPDTVGGFGPVHRGRQPDGVRPQLDWLEDFRSVEIVGSHANIVDEIDGLDLDLEVQRLTGVFEDDEVSLDVSVSLSAEERAGTIQLALTSSDRLLTNQVSLRTSALQPARLAPRNGRLAVFQGVAVPVDAALDLIYNRETGLETASLDLAVGEGNIAVAGGTDRVKSAAMVATLDPGAEEMRVERVELASDRLSLSGEGLIRDVGRLYDGDIGTSPKFDLDLSGLTVDLTPTFESALRIESAKVVGELDLDEQSLSLDRIVADFGGYGLTAVGEMVAGEAGLSRLALSGRTTTDLSAPQLLALWPVEAADGARRWIDRAVLGGRLQDTVFDVALDEAFFADPALTEDRLKLSFSVSDGAVRYISTMTPLTDAVGRGRIDGNRFDFALEGGRIGDVRIPEGEVSIPQLTPKGGDILIEARGMGDASDLLSLINQPPFGYLDRYGVDPEGFAGTADIKLNIRRPLLEYFDRDRIEYAVEGRFEDASAPFEFGPLGIRNANVSVRGGKEGLFVSGPANLGPWRTNVSWEERYGRDGEPTRYRISGPLGQDSLDGFGMGLRQVFGGEIGVEIEALGRGISVEEASVVLDLTAAELSFGDVWSKASGEAGRLQASVATSGDGVSVRDLRLVAPGLDILGQAEFEPTLSLRRAALDRLAIDGLIDGRIVVMPDVGGARLKVEASGDRLDISDFVRAALDRRGDAADSMALSLDASFNEMTLGPGYAIDNAAVTYRHDGDGIESLSLRGMRPDGQVRAELMPSADRLDRSARLVVPDLSQALASMLSMEAVQGGRFDLDATLPPRDSDGPIIGRVEAREFILRDAPFLAQILSLASLTGFVDTLSGGGLAFEGLDFDFALQDQTLSVREARLRGPALGMTGAGEIGLGDRTIDFGGTLVPSYTANSLLGDIPLLGDLFVGRDGEGVFALTYSVDGSFSQAQIAINPLSALTPGFIRGIFRESRSDLPDSVLEEIEAVRPDPVED